MMKKTLCIVLVLALVAALAAGCAGAATPGAASGDLTFGNVAYYMADNWNEYSTYAFEYAAEKNGVKVVLVDGENDVAKSVSGMEALIQQDVDGISIFPISPEQGAQLIKMANEAEIPITVENLYMEIQGAGVADDAYVAAIGCVYSDIGYAAIKWLSENVENANYFYCAGAVGGGVYESYQIGVDKANAEFADKITCAGLLNTSDWSAEDGLDLTANFINSGTPFNCIFANSDQIAQGCYQALVDAGMEKDIPIVSTGGSVEAYDFVKDGTQAANMTAPVSLQGVQTFKNLYEFVTAGTKPDPMFQSLPVIPVSAENIDDWIKWDDYEGAYNYVYGLN